MKKEFLNEFTRRKSEELGHNAPDNISTLWYSITDYSDTSHKLGSQGNSGEFHDDSEEQRISDELGVVQAKLIENFKEVTGFKPELHILKYDNGTWKQDMPIWILKG